MSIKKEGEIGRYYLKNIINGSFDDRTKDEILRWVEKYSKLLFGFELDNVWNEHGHKRYIGGRKYKTSDKYEYKEMLRQDIKNVRAMLDYRGVVDITKHGYDKRMDMLLDIFKLSPAAQTVLRYFIYAEQMDIMYSFELDHRCADAKNYRICSYITGIPLRAVEKLFSYDGEFIRRGILTIDDDHDISLSDTFKKMVRSKPSTEAQVKRLMFGVCAQPALTRGNFNYIAEEYDLIRTILYNAVRKRTRGVNILIYGEPGTGKTEMCKSIVRDVGARLYTLLENSESKKKYRVRALAITQTLLGSERDSVLLFDEAEDAFTRSIFESKDSLPSKLFYNRMLEENQIPVIWISNNIGPMDPAYIRRFTYAFEVEKPDQSAKEGIWKNICAKHKVKLERDKIAEYAEAYDIAPSFINTAVGTAKLTESTDVIKKVIVSLQKATHGVVEPTKKRDDKTEFVPELLNTDVDLINLTDKLVQKGKLKFSLCLYGEPGTGKSAFARYLAKKMGLKVEQKRASDLMSCLVGESEQNIARAFEEARDTKSMLVFDEADSFLRSRKMAERSWEATLVNEMLTQMESHPYPFVCTTNLMRNLDEASLRRFMFKVKHEFMKTEQVRLAFTRFFGINVGDKISVNHLTHLTPGDFAVVKGKIDFLDIEDCAEIIRLLEEEQSVKGVKTAKMGFARK